MRHIILFLLCVCAVSALGQNNIKKTAAVTYTQGVPTWVPAVASSSEISIDTSTGKIYQWHRSTSAWLQLGQGIDVISGTIAPAYTPARNMSLFAINAADSLYHYRSGAWRHINAGGGVTDGDKGDIDVASSGTVWTVDTGAVNMVKIAAGAVDSTKVGTGALSITDLGQHGATLSQLLKWNGTQWAPAIDSVGDNWGSQVVETDATLTGDGTSGDPLAWAGASVSGPITGSGTSGFPLNILSASIDSTHVKNYGLSVLDLGQHGASSGQAIKWNGTQWAPGDVTTGSGTAPQVAFWSAGTALSGSSTLTYQTNTLKFLPSAVDTIIYLLGEGSNYFGVSTMVDTFNGAATAYKVGALNRNGRLYITSFETYMQGAMRQVEGSGIEFRGTTGSMYLHPNGDQYSATTTGDNSTHNRNLHWYFTSGGTMYGNPVVFQHNYSANDSTGNAFEFLARNTASGGITIPDSTLFRVGNWDHGTAMEIKHSGKVGIGTTSPAEKLSVAGNISLTTAGNKLKIATGSNASIGTATLVAGTVTVSTTAVATGSTIFLTCNTPGGTQGFLSAPAASIVNGTSFVINSSAMLDTSTVNWIIIN